MAYSSVVEHLAVNQSVASSILAMPVSKKGEWIMIFREAFEAMKHGAKVKLPGWNGYWCWDNDKQTI